MSEAARALLDGHIQLSQALADAGRYPAVDVVASNSRMMPGVVTPEHSRAAQVVRRAIATLKETEDARALGLPQHDPWVAAAQREEKRIEHLLRQGTESVAAADALAELHKVAQALAT